LWALRCIVDAPGAANAAGARPEPATKPRG
jgi:hypothetical protein